MTTKHPKVETVKEEKIVYEPVYAVRADPTLLATVLLEMANLFRAHQSDADLPVIA